MSEMTYGWSAEMVVKAGRAGLRYREVPVGYRRRVGVSKVGGTLRGSLGAGAAITGAILRHSRWRPRRRPRERPALDRRQGPPCGPGQDPARRGRGRPGARWRSTAASSHDLAARFAGAPFPVGWYVTPPDAWADLRAIVSPSGPAPPVLAQPPGDWTARQRALFRGAAARGERRTVLIASDSPHLEIEVVESALAALERDDVAIGPTHDGGYYLIGMRGWHDVLAGVAMSTDAVLDGVLAVARRTGATVAVLEPTFDIDGRDDLGLLAALDPRRDDLAATRRALAGIAA